MVPVLSPGNLWLIWLSWGLTTRQHFWVILCCLPEKGRREIGDSRGDKREGQWRKENEWKWRNRRNKNIPPLPLPYARIAGLAQTVSKYQLDARWRKTHDTFASPNYTTRQRVNSMFGTPIRKFMLDLEDFCFVMFFFFFFFFLNSAKVHIQLWENKMIVYGRRIIISATETTAILWTFGIKGK